MNNLLEIQELINSYNFRNRIGMYLGEKNIHILNGFLHGFQYAEDLYGISKDQVHFLEGFHDYVAKYYDWYESTAGWKNIILKESDNDPARAVDEFFKLYDCFVMDRDKVTNQ